MRQAWPGSAEDAWTWSLPSSHSVASAAREIRTVERNAGGWLEGKGPNDAGIRVPCVHKAGWANNILKQQTHTKGGRPRPAPVTQAATLKSRTRLILSPLLPYRASANRGRRHKHKQKHVSRCGMNLQIVSTFNHHASPDLDSVAFREAASSRSACGQVSIWLPDIRTHFQPYL